MADDIYTNIRVPSYQIGRFQFKSGVLRLTTEDDKTAFERILGQIPQPDRDNIVLLTSETYFEFPPDWILRLDLRLAEIATAGPEAQAAARENLGLPDTIPALVAGEGLELVGNEVRIDISGLPAAL